MNMGEGGYIQGVRRTARKTLAIRTLSANKQYSGQQMIKKVFMQLSYASALVIWSSNASAIGSELILNQVDIVSTAKSVTASQRIKSLSQERFFKGASVVKVDTSAFLGNIVNLNFKNYHFKFLKNGGEVTDSSNWSWTGTADDGMGDAVVTSYQGILVGSFHYHGTLLRLDQTSSNEYILEELDERSPKPTGNDAVGLEEGQKRAADIAERAKKKPLTELAATTTPVINILVAYSSAAVSYFGSASAAVANINAEVTDLNAILRASQVNLTARLVGTVMVNYTGARTAASTLAAFQSMPDVKMNHDTYGADVMMYVGSLSDFCGLANVLPAPANAYGVVDQACMTTQHTFAHEFGHLLGAGHDTLNSAPNGAQPYAHGALLESYSSSGPLPIVESFWCAHTVMAYAWIIDDAPNEAAYPCRSDPLLALFSSPLITTQLYAGYAGTLRTITIPIGSSSVDNARMLNESASTVAGNHNTKISSGTVAYRMVMKPNVLNIHVGEVGFLTFDSYNQDGSDAGNPPGSTQVWTSSNPSVATADPLGVRVTGVSIGSAQIILSDPLVTISSSSATVNVAAAQVLNSIVATPNSLALNVTQTATLTLTGYDKTGAVMPLVAPTNWTSANPSIASVASNGVVKGLAVGTTSVTAVNGGLSTTINVSVIKRPTVGPPSCGRACSGIAPPATPAVKPKS